MSLLGAILAFLMGTVLGILGAGGSIMTVPILVYALNLEPKTAIPTSLVIVAATAIVGAFRYWRQGLLKPGRSLLFGLFTMAGAFLSARVLSPYTSGSLQLVLFACMMLAASYFMFKGPRAIADPPSVPERPRDLTTSWARQFVFGAQGLCVGMVTGLVGIGGGFLIVPFLVLGAKIPVREAVGTSLLLISMNAVSGFLGYFNKVQFDWALVGFFIGISVVGTLVGAQLTHKIPQNKLRRIFAIFVLLMAVFILVQQLLIFA